MKQESEHTSKIIHLIEAMAELSGEDLEEAREVLKRAGKDPDALLKKSIDKLEKIRQTVRSANSGNQLLFFEAPTKTVLVHDADYDGSQLLTANQVYDTFIRKQPLMGVPFDELTFGPKVAQLKFMHALRQLNFVIAMQPREAVVKAVLVRRQDRQPVALNHLAIIIPAGYVIIGYNCYALEKDWLLTASQFALSISGNSISLQQAIGYFAKRTEFPFLQFEPEQLDLKQILQSAEFTSQTSLFVKTLYPYQEDGLKWLQYCCVNRLGGILGDDMGLGKTAQAIALIAWCIEQNVFHHMLIVVPGTLLENWRREFRTFAPSIIPFIHHGSFRTGAVSTLLQERVVITSYSLVINDRYLLDKINWGIILLDEASLIRNPDSERRIALGQLYAEVRIAMTGTPLENSLTDLWSLTDFVRPGYLGSRKEFAATYIRQNIDATLAGPSLSWLRTAVSYLMLRRKKEDVLDSLPERNDIHQALEMNETEAHNYEELRTKALEQLNIKHKGQVVLQLIQQLRQFTTHPLLISREDILKVTLPELAKTSVKFSRTLELLDEIQLNREKVLIFTEYLDMIDVFRRTVEAHYNIPVFNVDGRLATIERQPTIDSFSKTDGFSVMILNPRVAGLGLNIIAANHVIHYTRQWNPALEEQATARVYRNGQLKGVNIYYLYYSDSIEETIDERLRAKRTLSSEVIQETATEGSIEEYLEAISKSPIKK
jgi:SNF2 family DNA or RNA helicase